jgi:hypothetical protein
MKLNLWLLCCVLMASQAHAEADDIYLEGISSLGKQRVAYVFINAAKFSLKEGENLTRWKITRIGQRSIVLADAGGKETELVLHNRLPPEPSEASMVATSENPPDTKSDKDAKANKDHAQASEDVPAGYRKVQTPFGEVVVRDDKPLPSPPAEEAAVEKMPATANSQPDAHATTPPPEEATANADKKDAKEPEVRPGYHKVRTPFGDIWIEDKVTQNKPEVPAPAPPPAPEM